MKVKGLIITLIAAGITLLSSCSGGYSCPTYSQDSNVDQPTMVKELPSKIEINS